MPAVTRGISRQDVLLAVLVGVVEVAGTTLAAGHQHVIGARPFDAGGYLLLALGAGLLLWVRRNAPAVLVAVLVVTTTYAMLDYPRGPIFLALVVAFVHTVLDGCRTIAYPALLIAYVTLTLVVAEVNGHEPPSMQFLIGAAAWLLVLLVGSELIRLKRQFVTERRRRRQEAELALAEEARRRAGEERLEIARELHDVMAHSISLINVQAGVALELMDRRPEQARQALTAIKAASKDALLEVQSVLASLRGTGPGGAEPSEPAGPAPGPRPPTLATLEDLADRARLAGIEVCTRVDGELPPLPIGLDQAAARIIQEALTNVARHAGRSAHSEPAVARVEVSYGGKGDGELVIVVDNDGEPALGNGASPGPGDDVCLGGRGIGGMRERAEAYGGSLHAGPRTGGFRVEARLPVSAARTAKTSGAW